MHCWGPYLPLTHTLSATPLSMMLLKVIADPCEKTCVLTSNSVPHPFVVSDTVEYTSNPDTMKHFSEVFLKCCKSDTYVGVGKGVLFRVFLILAPPYNREVSPYVRTPSWTWVVSHSLLLCETHKSNIILFQLLMTIWSSLVQ